MDDKRGFCKPIRWPRLTRLKIEGFRSFGYVGEEIELRPLSFVVGANASGKSNLIAALQFLKAAVQTNVESVVSEWGGVGAVWNRASTFGEEPGPLTFSLTLDFGGDEFGTASGPVRLFEFKYMLRVEVDNKTARPVITRESLDGEVTRNGGDRLKYRLWREAGFMNFSDPLLEDSKPVSMSAPLEGEQESRLALDLGFFSIPCVLIRSRIASWQFYDIDPNVARRPSEVVRDAALGPHGENLGAVLYRVGQKGRLEGVVEGLRGAVPGFRDVQAVRQPADESLTFQIGEEHIGTRLDPASASDGTIRLLALLALVYDDTAGSTLVALEEPENGIHPHLAEHVVDILRYASETRQFLVTTHNPAFLDHLDPSEVLLCDKTGGFTQVRRASAVEDIDVFREHFSLGDLWTQGTLGGVL